MCTFEETRAYKQIVRYCRRTGASVSEIKAAAIKNSFVKNYKPHYQLSSLFFWAESPEGDLFWRRIANNDH